MSWFKNPALGKKHQLVPRQKDRTTQTMRDELNINRIVSTFLKTGQLPLSNRVPQYGDASALPNLQQALSVQAQARELYNALPQQIKNETQNNPALLEAWLNDPRNLDLAIKYNLLTLNKPISNSNPPPTGVPAPAHVVDSGAPTPSPSPKGI